MRKYALLVLAIVLLALLILSQRNSETPRPPQPGPHHAVIAHRAGPQPAPRKGNGPVIPAAEYRNLTPADTRPRPSRPRLSTEDLTRIEKRLSSQDPASEIAALDELGGSEARPGKLQLLRRYLEHSRTRELSEPQMASLMYALGALGAEAMPIYRAVLRGDFRLEHDNDRMILHAIIKTGTHGRTSLEDYDLLIRYVRHPEFGETIIHHTARFARPELDLLHRQLFDELERAPPREGKDIIPLPRVWTVIQAIATRKSEDGRAFLLEKLGEGRQVDAIISRLPAWQREEDVARIASYLGHPDGRYGQAAVSALLEFTIPAAIPYIYQIATDEKWYPVTRRKAVIKLHKLGDKRAIPMFIEMLKDPNYRHDAHVKLSRYSGLRIPWDPATAYETWKSWHDKEYRK